jgi:hypothetical protein
LVYGPLSPYLAAAAGLQLLALAGVLDYIAEMISKTLLGVQAGKLAFVVNVVAAVAALALALALIGPLGVFGACVALLIANSVRMIGATTAIAWLISREKAKAQVGSRRGATAGIEKKATSTVVYRTRLDTVRRGLLAGDALLRSLRRVAGLRGDGEVSPISASRRFVAVLFSRDHCLSQTGALSAPGSLPLAVLLAVMALVLRTLPFLALQV